MSLDSIVQVVISRETKVPSRVGFGTGAFVSADAVFQERIKAYGDLAEVQNDPLAGGDSLQYATRYFSQSNAPTALYIIKKGTDRAHVQTVTFSAALVTGNVFNGDVNSAAVGPVAFNTDSDTTIDDIATAIQGEAGVTSAVRNPSNNLQIIVTGPSPGTVLIALENFAVTGGASQADVTIATTQYPDTVATYVESIAAAQNDNDDWYSLSIASRTNADILAVAADIEAKTKIFGYASNEAGILGTGTTDIAAQLDALNYDRTFGIYHPDADGSDSDPYPEAAWLGEQLPKDPGSSTWKFKTLAGVAVTNLNTTEITNATGKSINTYVEIASLAITQEGVMASGEFIDVIRGSDFIQVRIQEEVYTVLVNAQKVPYTDPGVALLENAVDAVLRLSTNQGILAADPAYEISAVPVAQVSQVDKGSRFYDGLSFVGTLAGAIHKTRIEGRLVL